MYKRHYFLLLQSLFTPIIKIIEIPTSSDFFRVIMEWSLTQQTKRKHTILVLIGDDVGKHTTELLTKSSPTILSSTISSSTTSSVTAKTSCATGCQLSPDGTYCECFPGQLFLHG